LFRGATLVHPGNTQAISPRCMGRAPPTHRRHAPEAENPFSPPPLQHFWGGSLESYENKGMFFLIAGLL